LMISFMKSEPGLLPARLMQSDWVLLLLLNEKNKKQNKRISEIFFVRVFIFQEVLQAIKNTVSSKICNPLKT
jgi:hypothetical protein